jgi:Ca-activated chloride channel family protein
MAVRRDLFELGDHLDTASFSIVTFGTSATLQLPFTTDRVAFEDEVLALQVEEPEAGSGSSIGIAAPMLASVLDRAKTVGPDHIPVVVFLSDGESTDEGAQASFAAVGQRISSGVVLGYGTVQGGVMPVERVPVDQPAPAREDVAVISNLATGAPVRSRLDPENLDKVAYQLGAAYAQGDGTHDMAAVATELEAVALATLEPGEPERELRWFWALVLLLLLLPELRRGWRMYWQARRAGRA